MSINIAILGTSRVSSLIDVIVNSSSTKPKQSQTLTPLRVWHVPQTNARLWEVCSGPDSNAVYSLLPSAASAFILIINASQPDEVTSLLPICKNKPIFLVVDHPDEASLDIGSLLPNEFHSKPLAVCDLSSRETARLVKHDVMDWISEL
ncbi:hypothetical protein P9112_011129 [Eukaryota sp. TZLM1-RC]